MLRETKEVKIGWNLKKSGTSQLWWSLMWPHGEEAEGCDMLKLHFNVWLRTTKSDCGNLFSQMKNKVWSTFGIGYNTKLSVQGKAQPFL
jgi:hypothetical protein